jgi:hypothetical protein
VIQVVLHQHERPPFELLLVEPVHAGLIMAPPPR